MSSSLVIFIAVLGAIWGLMRIQHLWSIIRGYEADGAFEPYRGLRVDAVLRRTRDDNLEEMVDSGTRSTRREPEATEIVDMDIG